MNQTETSLKFWKKQDIEKYIPNFVVRIDQNKIINQINQAITLGNQLLLIEAGTGIGKSYAYLAPILDTIYSMYDKDTVTELKSIISTNNLVLQNQIFFKDLPMVSNIIKDSSKKSFDITKRLLYGRSNYVCKKIMDIKPVDEISFSTKNIEKEYKHLVKYVAKNNSSDEITFENAEIKEPYLISEFSCAKRNCKNCDKKCLFATQEYKESNIVVTNHSYIISSFQRYKKNLRNNSKQKFKNILEDRIVIFDEAHKIEDALISANHLEFTLNSIYSKIKNYTSHSKLEKKKILDMYLSIVVDNVINAPDYITHINKLYDELKDSLTDYKNYFENIIIEDIPENIHIKDNDCFSYTEIIEYIKKSLNISSRLSNFLNETYEYFIEYYNGLYNEYKKSKDALSKANYETIKKIENDIFFIRDSCNEHKQFFTDFLTLSNKNTIRYIIRRGKNVTLGFNDLEIAKKELSSFFKEARCVIFLSATLSTNRNFEYFKDLLGIDDRYYKEIDIKEYIYKSPFDYKTNMKIIANNDGHEDLYELKEILTTHDDGALLLFTSIKEMNRYYDFLSPFLKDKNVLKQGLETRQNILQKSKENKSIIFAVASFWEGIDLQGDHLNFLYINKLPFDNPKELFIEKKMEILKEQGYNVFMEYSLPRALMKYKQGIGRLIRTETDNGIVLIKDNRIITHPTYGRYFIKESPTTVYNYRTMDELNNLLN